MILIEPSLASADQLNLQTHIDTLKNAPSLHLDIEDGNFVPNITFGLKTVRAVARYAKQRLDAHLMVSQPENYVLDLLQMGVHSIAIHIEAGQYPAVQLQALRKGGGRAGLAFNCMAPIEAGLAYREWIDYLLIMTSEPDGMGQRFNEHILQKISRARTLYGPEMEIMADGGIGEEQMAAVAACGANVIVMGRTIWNAPDPQEQYGVLMERLQRYGEQ